MHTLFPPIEPNHTFRLKVSDLHELYVEEAGNPTGVPVVFLHGGPGGSILPHHRQLFDPTYYRIILFDQRGCGRSTPHACLKDNTTWVLVADMEYIRQHLGIPNWLVFGGSWGSTLALAYAQSHPNQVTGLILRGIFLCRQEELDWFYQQGCSVLQPERWQTYVAQVPEPERDNMVEAYYRLLTHDDETIRINAARAWSQWEAGACKLIPDPDYIDSFEDPQKALAMARIECHYFINHAFFNENQLLNNIESIRHIPTWIIHGRYDIVCPPKNAWDLHTAFPEAHLNIILDAGHAYDEPGVLDALIRATEDFKAL
ncbi:MAG: prolyl aminopeptidase [Vampirovibrionales bacterium]|nr:prolyl aminopeptidase [Vampirovibrionales bacterium]